MYTETLPSTYYTEAELEAMYMGTESEARKMFQRNNSFSQRRQSSDGRQRSFSRDSQYGRYTPRSRYDIYKSPGERGDLACHDWSQTPNFPRLPNCIGCRCMDCTQNKKTCKEIKKLILKNTWREGSGHHHQDSWSSCSSESLHRGCHWRRVDDQIYIH